jgi:hypothetical protein
VGDNGLAGDLIGVVRVGEVERARLRVGGVDGVGTSRRRSG